jgi:hypothetical protein
LYPEKHTIPHILAWAASVHMKKSLSLSALVLVVVAAGLWVFGRPAYRGHKEKGALERAKEFVAQGDFRNGSLCARQVLTLNPANIEACQIMAQLTEQVHAPQVLDWQRRIVELSPTIDNKLRLAATALRVESPPCPIAAQTLADLAGSAQGSAAYHVVSAELALKLRRVEEAQSHFLDAGRLEPANEYHRLNLAVLQLRSTNEVVAAHARATLKALRPNTNLATTALRWLIDDSVRRQDWQAAEVSSLCLLADPRADLDDRLQHLTILRQAGRLEFQPFLESVQVRAATNAFAIYAVAAWMTADGRPALPWLTNLPAKMQTEQPVPLALAEAYLEARDWSGLENCLQDQKWGDQEFRRLAFLSRAAGEQKRAMAADAHWRLAVRQAGDRLGPLTWLLTAAGEWRRAEAREALLWQIAQTFPCERWALLELRRSYELAGNTLGLNRVFSAIAAACPEDFAAQNNLAATAMLLKINPARTHEVARETYARHADQPIVVSTYAYSLHLQGRTKDGLNVLEKLKPEALEQPAVALYYGVLLSADGQPAKAAKHLALVQSATLLPEEKTLLAETLKRL